MQQAQTIGYWTWARVAVGSRHTLGSCIARCVELLKRIATARSATSTPGGMAEGLIVKESGIGAHCAGRIGLLQCRKPHPDRFELLAQYSVGLFGRQRAWDHQHVRARQ